MSARLALALCGLLAACHEAPAPAPVGPPAAQTPDAVLNVSATPLRAEGEEFIAVNPANADNIIVGSNQWQPLTDDNAGNPSLGPSGLVDCAVWASHDGGLTWTGGGLSDSGLGRIGMPLATWRALPVVRSAPGEFDNAGNVISADQNIVFDRHGTAWYQCINFGVRTGDVVVHVYRSTDGGRSWEPPVRAFSEIDTRIQIDRPFLAIDNSGGPRDGTLYLTWETMFYQAWLPEVYVRSSSDGGRTWGPVVRVDAGTQETLWDPRQFPVVGADGALYVVYATGGLQPPREPQFMPLGLRVARSTDGGKTFTQHVVDDQVDRAASPDEAFEYFLELISALAADPQRPGRIAVAWPDDRSGESRILLRHSTDGGDTWSGLIDVSDAAAGQGIQHDHVTLAYLPDGRLVVGWRDRRASGGAWSAPWEIFARVLDVAPGGALTPGRVVRVTSAPQAPTTGRHGGMPSEYLHMAAGPFGVDFAWDEMRGTFPDNVYRRIPLAALE